MNPILLRYAGLALIAAIFGVGGGYLSKNTSLIQQSGTTVAIPAKPFPGQGIPAIPAVPAIPPQKGKPDIGKTSILFIQGEAGKNQVINPIFITDIPHFGYISDAFNMIYSEGAIKNVIVGNNFSPTHNTIYWDGAVLVRNMEARENSDGNQNIYLPVPANTELGSFHKVYVKSPYGTSNTIQVQAVEHHDVPFFLGDIRPSSGPIGTKGETRIWDSLLGTFWPVRRPDAPLSAKLYFAFQISSNQIKSGAEGLAYVFVSSELERNATVPDNYTFTVPSEAIYCPSWGWEASDCALAHANTIVPLKVGQQYQVFNSFFVYQYKYRGLEKGWAITADLPNIDHTSWFHTFTITP